MKIKIGTLEFEECSVCLQRRYAYMALHPEITDNESRELFLNGKPWIHNDPLPHPNELMIGLKRSPSDPCTGCKYNNNNEALYIH